MSSIPHSPTHSVIHTFYCFRETLTPIHSIVHPSNSLTSFFHDHSDFPFQASAHPFLPMTQPFHPSDSSIHPFRPFQHSRLSRHAVLSTIRVKYPWNSFYPVIHTSYSIHPSVSHPVIPPHSFLFIHAECSWIIWIMGVIHQPIQSMHPFMPTIPSMSVHPFHHPYPPFHSFYSIHTNDPFTSFRHSSISYILPYHVGDALDLKQVETGTLTSAIKQSPPANTQEFSLHGNCVV